MTLREIKYQEDYRTGYDNLVEDFFQPSLARAQFYWRAVGYFSSSALESFGAPLGKFIKNGGCMKLVTSVELSQSDLEAIENGSPKSEICAKRIEEIIDNEFAQGVGDGTVRLARLLEFDRLEIQIAVPKKGIGIYHEKIGIFFDTEDFVAFTGSSNESRYAFEHNRECIDVYPSWTSSSRANRKRKHFEELWKGIDHGVDVYSFPDAARKKLLQVSKTKKSAVPISVPKKQDKWQHQDKAMRKFLEAERGILEMATGTGKTWTAIKILSELIEKGKINSVIICTNGNDLLDQWFSELYPIGERLGTMLFRHYRQKKDSQDFLLSPRMSMLIVSRSPLAMVLRGLSRSIAHQTLLIHDEVHGLGSPQNRKQLHNLSQNIRFRLGLSATPEREYDNEGNDFLLEHVGPVLMRFTLKSAIQNGILAPFNYFALNYSLTEDDKERIQNVYKKKSARQAAGNPMRDEEVWIDIARVYKTSKAKLPIFEEFIQSRQHLLKRCIVFVETREYGSEVKEIIHRYRSDFHTYYSGEDSETLHKFANSSLECLITCHRLSEGIDIHSLQTVILFSSARAKLETIQRIGRCLRADPKNLGKIANIVDFVRDSETDDELNADQERANWLRELSKVRAK